MSPMTDITSSNSTSWKRRCSATRYGDPIREVVKERPFRYARPRDDGVHREPLQSELLGQHQPGFDQVRPRLLRGQQSLVRHLHDC